MSLEAHLQANTEALLKLTAALLAHNAGNAASTPEGAQATTKKPAPGKKGAAAQPAEADELGNPAGTLYFYTEKHDSIYSRKPGDPAIEMAGGVEVTAAEFKAHGARIAAKIAAADEAKKAAKDAKEAAAAAGGDDDPFAASEPEVKVDQKTMTEKLMELAKAKGREVIVTLLKELGAPNVPGIPADKYAEAHKIAVELLAA